MLELNIMTGTIKIVNSYGTHITTYIKGKLQNQEYRGSHFQKSCIYGKKGNRAVVHTNRGTVMFC